MVFTDVVTKLQVFGRVDVQKFGAYPDHEELADFLFRCEFVQGLLRPFLACAIEMDWAGLLILFFSKRRAGKKTEDCQEQANLQAAHEQTIAWHWAFGLRRQGS